MKQDIYILGGEGFIGMNLAEYFGTNKNYIVRLISKRKSKFNLLDNVKVEYIYGNIYDCNFKLNNDSIIIHLTRTSFNKFDDFKNKEENLKNYINSFSPKKVIVFSSAVVYTIGNSLYKQEKVIFEKVWVDSSIVARLFNTYGKYQLPNKQGSLIVTIFYNKLKGLVTNINDINQVRNFIYAGDIGKVIEKIIIDNINGIIDIGNETITIGELLKNVGDIISNDRLKILGNKEDIFNVEPKNDKNIEYTTLLDGLNETYSFLEKNIERL